MKKINKYIQYIIFAGIGICLLGSIVESSLLIWLLFITIPIGLTQYLGSFIDVVIRGKSSPYLIHFILSTIVLFVIVSNSDLNHYVRLNYVWEYVANFIGIAGSIGLALYFWIITFSKEDILLAEKHSVYDL